MSHSRLHPVYIIEFLRVGNAIKVSACDPETLTEVAIVGSAHTPQELLERTAIRKLEYVLAERRPEQSRRGA